MAGKRSDSSSLADPQEALGFYLDSLLMDLPEVPPEVVSTEPPTDAVVPPTEPMARPFAESPVEPQSPVALALSSETSAQQPVPTVMSSRPFAEPERTLPLLAGPPLLPRLMVDSLDVETIAEDTQDQAAAEISTCLAAPPVAPVQSMSAEPIPPVKAAPASVPDRAPIPPGVAPEIPPDDTVDASLAEARRRPTAKIGSPSWAGNDFQCLTFVVAGLTLAAPLDRLHGIVEWPGELTELPGYADWFMGLLPNRGQNVRVIDTAQVIMPDGRVPDARPVLERVNYVVLIDDGRWGLAADAIARILTLSPDGVRWRGERGRRPWLAGTAVEQMCAVLDIDNLSEQLAEGLRLGE